MKPLKPPKKLMEVEKRKKIQETVKKKKSKKQANSI